jgi:hypothetical protein
MDLFPVLIAVCAVAMLAVLIATVALTGKKRICTELEDQSGRLLMLELELATLQREVGNGSAANTHIKTERCEPALILLESNSTAEREHSVDVATDANVNEIEGGEWPRLSPLTMLPPVAAPPMAGEAFSLKPFPPAAPLRQKQPSKLTEIDAPVPIKEELAAMNPLARIGITLFVLGIASWHSRPSVRRTFSS